MLSGHISVPIAMQVPLGRKKENRLYRQLSVYIIGVALDVILKKISVGTIKGDLELDDLVDIFSKFSGHDI